MPPGVGIHQWLFGQVRIAQLKGFTAEYIRKTFAPALREMFVKKMLRREVTARDLDQAISNIFRTIDAPIADEPAPMTYDPVNGWCKTARTLKAVLDHNLVDRALTSSSVSNTAVIPDSVGHWHQLFAPTDMLCVGKSADDYCVVRASELSAQADAQFIVPNPLRKPAGRTQSGRLTSHCRDAVGPRRYIIMENDHGFSLDQQTAILFWVAEKTETPLRLIVRSGGKSLHGWFDTAGACEVDIFNWVKLVARVGFDPRLILPEQFCRMPGGFRPDKNVRQEILYTNIA